MTLDRISWFIGQIARPVGIMAACLSAGIASIIMAAKVTDGNDGYLLAGAIWLGAGAIFGAKALEERGKAKSQAEVEIARATGASPAPQQVEVINTPDAPIPVEPTN